MQKISLKLLNENNSLIPINEILINEENTIKSQQIFEKAKKIMMNLLLQVKILIFLYFLLIL